MRDIDDDINSLVFNAWNDADTDELSLSAILGGEIIYRSILYGIYAFYLYDHDCFMSGNSLGQEYDRLTKTNDILKFNWFTIGRIHYIYSLAIKQVHTEEDYDNIERIINGFINDDGLLDSDCYSHVLKNMCTGIYTAIKYLNETEVDF